MERAPRRVAIDARALADPASEGYWYTLNLVHSLAYVTRDVTFLLFLDEDVPEERLPHGDHCQHTVLTAPRTVWKASALGPAAHEAGADLLHVQGLLPVLPPLPVMTTIRSLGPLLAPTDHPGPAVFAWRHMLPLQLAWAAAVIVPWGEIARGLAAATRLDEDRFTVVSPGVEPTYRPQCESVTGYVTQRFGLPPRYLVGRCRRKAALAAVIEVWQACRAAEPDLALVVDCRYEGELPIIALDLWDERIAPGVMSAAAVVVVAGDDEPDLAAATEAMACGTPVVGPDSALLREVVAGGGVTGDVAAQATAVARWRDDEDRRVRAMRAGLARTQRLTWPAMATATLACYERALAAD